ncbi:MAG: asparaginase [Ruminococcus sp.]|nr:asparaginase [Ruminococcus sp.]
MKLLLIHTGGTIATERRDGALSVTSKSTDRLIEMYRNLGGTAEFEVDSPFDILSETMNTDNLLQLSECIKKHKAEKYDGIIVTHGTDTVQYTSAYLSYAFGLCETPIVVVSANYPLSDSRSNGIANFSAAADFIMTAKRQGVFVAYRNTGKSKTELHRGTRLLAHEVYDDSLKSVFNSPFGSVESGKFIANPNYSENKSKAAINPCFNKGVLYIRPYVGQRYPDPQGYKAVLLEGYHSGTLNTAGEELKGFCRQAAGFGIPVYLTGNSDGFEYETKREYDSLGIITLPPAAPTAMYVKLLTLAETELYRITEPIGGDFLR